MLGVGLVLLWRQWRAVAFCVVLVALGGCLGKARTELLATPALETDTSVVTVTGWIERVEFISDNRQRAVVRVVEAEPELPSPGNLRVRISFSRKRGDLVAGVPVSFKARLFAPKRPVAPGAFDFARRDWFRGIGGSGFGFGDVTVLSGLGTGPLSLVVENIVSRIRVAIASAVRRHLTGNAAEFMIAVLTGVRGGLSETTVEQLRAAGLAHLLAISGLHMGLVAFTLFALCRAMLALSSHATLHWPIKKWSAAMALVGGAGYLVLSGAAVSTQRAYLMIAIMFAAVILDRPAISMRNVALAALAILLFRPESVLNVSFQMSFLAVVGLVALYEVREGRWRTQGNGRTQTSRIRRTARQVAVYFAGICLSTLVASLATGPIAAFHFNRVAVFGVIGNLAAIPLMGLLIMPFALVGTLLVPVGLEGPFYTVAGWGANVLLWVSADASAIPGAVRHVASMPGPALILMVFGLLWICLWRSWWRWAGIGIALCGLLVNATSQRPDILIEQDAKLVAVRNLSGEFVLSSASRARFAVERWLAADGDAATPAEAVGRAGMRCDAEGCAILAKGGIEVAYLQEPSALWEECNRADILIAAFSLNRACSGPNVLIDRFALYKYGAHALYLGENGVRVERVAEWRGNRPWTGRAVVNDTKKGAQKEDVPQVEESQQVESKAADRADRLANGLERVAFKFHDFGDWLLRFLR